MLSLKPISKQHWKSSAQRNRLAKEIRRRARANPQSTIRNPQFLDGEHPGYPAPDQIDSQYRPDHQGHANGGGVKNAQSTAARPGGASVRGVDEQGPGLAATTNRSQRSEERRVGKECRCRGWPEQ